jgi:hypothetical protein
MRAKELRDDAAALEALDETVTVELSLAAAWLLRDLIGLGGLTNRVKLNFDPDMKRLNEVVSPRPHPEDMSGHVSQWSSRQVERVFASR